MNWPITIVTLFPEMFPGPLGMSLAGKALAHAIWSLTTINIRDFAYSKHKTVDDTPYGGGAGMVLKPDVVHEALKQAVAGTAPYTPHIIYPSPRGRIFNMEIAHELSEKQSLVFLCGRYEGVDERVLQHWQVDEISLGDYILSGGELATLTILDACLRLKKGVLGDENSLLQESFENNLLEYPLYTKPQLWHGYSVPEVLLSGHHKEIEAWKHKHATQITKERRQDLWEKYIKKHTND